MTAKTYAFGDEIRFTNRWGQPATGTVMSQDGDRVYMDYLGVSQLFDLTTMQIIETDGLGHPIAEQTTSPEIPVADTKPTDDPAFERLFKTMFDYRRQISNATNSGRQLDEFWWRNYRDVRDDYRRAAAKAGISDPDAHLEDRYRNYYGL